MWPRAADTFLEDHMLVSPVLDYGPATPASFLSHVSFQGLPETARDKSGTTLNGIGRIVRETHGCTWQELNTSFLCTGMLPVLPYKTRSDI